MLPEIIQENRQKYLKPPTLEMILSFVEEVGVSYYHFEEYYGMAKGVIKNVKYGSREMPKRYWWIFYERIVPQYGVYNNFKKPTKRGLTKSVAKIVSRTTPEMDNHGRLGRLKTK